MKFFQNYVLIFSDCRKIFVKKWILDPKRFYQKTPKKQFNFYLKKEKKKENEIFYQNFYEKIDENKDLISCLLMAINQFSKEVNKDELNCISMNNSSYYFFKKQNLYLILKASKNYNKLKLNELGNKILNKFYDFKSVPLLD